jgi:hypothetical protein
VGFVVDKVAAGQIFLWVLPVFRRALTNNEKCPWTSSCLYSMSPTGGIFVKFDPRVFYENPSRNSKFGYNRTKVSGTLHEDLSTFDGWLQYEIFCSSTREQGKQFITYPR